MKEAATVRRPRKLGVLTGLAIVALCVAAARAFADPGAQAQTRAAGPSRFSSNSQSYTDTAGDSGAAPDVTAIDISNDDAGLVTFVLTFGNRPSLLSQDLVNIGIDVDIAAQPSTGRNGFDFVVAAGPSGSGLGKWNGAAFTAVPAPSLHVTIASTMTIQINESDLGLSGPDVPVGFVVLTSADGKTVGDSAPDSLLPGGVAIYEIRVNTTPATPLRLKGGLTVGNARAGSRLRVTLSYMRSDSAAPTTGPLTGKTIGCVARVAGRTLRPVERQSGGAIVNCAWLLPKTSKGKIVTGSVAVAFASVPTAKLTLRFSKKIS